MAYSNELICSVAVGTQLYKVGKEAVGLGAINCSNRCSR
jgi:hypothetical protein